MFQPDIHLLAEIARFRQYSRYFFRYETGSVPVPMHWPTQYILTVPADTIQNRLPCVGLQGCEEDSTIIARELSC